MSFDNLSDQELSNRLSAWNEDYHRHQVSYKDIKREYEGMYGMGGTVTVQTGAVTVQTGFQPLP